MYSLNNLAQYLELDSIYLKDESQRFALNAFKGLGASYAVANYFAEKLALDLSKIDFKTLLKKVKSAQPVTFATATDGNHGRGLAWAAQLFEQKAEVFMPRGSAPERLKAIQALGAEARITELNYDQTVEMTAELAAENNWVIIQDTAWQGYEKIPLTIMHGYSSIVSEIVEQLEKIQLSEITHIFLQAGVGSFAASITAAVEQIAGDKKPLIAIVEARKADCLFKSARSTAGEAKKVSGDLDTMMAGLACGEPNPQAWKILKTAADYYYSAEDIVSARGMRVLGNPLAGDPQIISGESGAVTLGIIYELMTKDKYLKERKELGLNKDAKILVINTEGDTDSENYRQVVWE